MWLENQYRRGGHADFGSNWLCTRSQPERVAPMLASPIRFRFLRARRDSMSSPSKSVAPRSRREASTLSKVFTLTTA